MSQKCPFCGAEIIAPGVFDCWTKAVQADPGTPINYHRGVLCYEHQLADQAIRLAEKDREIEALKFLRDELLDRLALWRSIGEHKIDWYNAESLRNKLKDLREI